MSPEQLKTKSKWLSKHLRHSPERIGLKLEAGGWVEVEKLLAAAQKHHLALTHSQLEAVVREKDKQRFAFSPDGLKIRANQGHSVEVDLGLTAQIPPTKLFHGTGAQNRELLLAQGLKKMRRQHVHLSTDLETATKVGARHGKPLIFEVNAAQMHADGFEFWRSDNGVWLCEQVPPQYLQL